MVLNDVTIVTAGTGANGASVDGINDATAGASTLTMNGGSITTQSLAGSAHGLIAYSGAVLTANNMTVNTLGTNSYGSIAEFGAQINLNDVAITTAGGQAHGLYSVSTSGKTNAPAQITADNTTVTTTGDYAYGAVVRSVASLSLDNTTISTSGIGSAALYSSTYQTPGVSSATLTNSSLTSAQAAGIRVVGTTTATTQLDVSLLQGTSVTGNTHALEVANNGQSATLNLVADNSTLNGGATVDAGSTANITLQNNSTWNMTSPVTVSRLLLDNATLRYGQTDTSLTTTDPILLLAGGGVIDTNGFDEVFAATLSGEGSITKTGEGTLTLTNAMENSGNTIVNQGTLAAGAGNMFSTASAYTVAAGGTLDLQNYNQTIDALDNSGIVNLGTASAGTTLTVNGNYQGNGGLLSLNTVLGDDDSATDKLVVNGNTAGTTYVKVNNLGGSGAETINGIEIVQVNGVSAGEFVKNGRIVAGAYDYSLVRGTGTNAPNWYLTSQISSDNPTRKIDPVDPVDPVTPVDPVDPVNPVNPAKEMLLRPESAAYSANLAAANNLFVTRLHDRLGETQYIDALTGEHKVTSLWLRNEGGHNRFRDESGQLRTQANRYVLQLGGDLAQWSNNGLDRFHLGLMAGYGDSKNNTVSRLSSYDTKGAVDGYSIGAYGTWYANAADKSGLYVDSWLQYSWFNNTVTGETLTSETYKSKGITASVESGYTFKLGESVANNQSYFIQPKAQLTWMGIKADDHREANGTYVTGEGDGNLQTRLGVKAFINGYSAQDKGKERVFQPFVEANWLHNSKDFSSNMDGISVKQDGAANIAELKVGVEGQLSKQINLWGNVAQQVGNQGYSDTAIMLGVKYNF
ncbi:type V secretion protein A [Serratia sp. S1B]|nr:type V secretion protein A [Serratia sp. S1B]